jgi:hypothetical protein
MTDPTDAAELAARRAVVASCYGIPPGYVPHCATCGQALPACACGPLPPVIAPFMPPAAVPAPMIERYGIRFCPVCNFTEQHCGCARQL